MSATGAPCDNTCSTSMWAPCRARYSAISAPGCSPCPARSLFRIDHQKRHGTSRDEEGERVCDRAPGLTARVPAEQYLVADQLGFPAARNDENGSAAGEQELYGRCVAIELLELTLTDHLEIGMKRAETEIVVRSASTDHPEFGTEIALCRNGLEAPANIGGRGLVSRFLLDEHARMAFSPIT
jgi:hypothetical protein